MVMKILLCLFEEVERSPTYAERFNEHIKMRNQKARMEGFEMYLELSEKGCGNIQRCKEV